jgi:hypothetical protein
VLGGINLAWGGYLDGWIPTRLCVSVNRRGACSDFCARAVDHLIAVISQSLRSGRLIKEGA